MAYVRPGHQKWSNYKFTVTNLNDPLIQDWKTYVKKENLIHRLNELDNPPAETYGYTTHKRHFMRIRARLGKNNPNAKLYRRGGKYYRPSSLDIKLEHGTRFDVYVGTRNIYKYTS